MNNITNNNLYFILTSIYGITALRLSRRPVRRGGKKAR